MSTAAQRSVLPLAGAREAQGAPLARYLRTRFGQSMFLANLCGAIDVFVLLGWVLTTPPVPPGENIVLRNTIGFVVYMLITFPLGGWGTYRVVSPVVTWLESGRPPTPEQRRAALRLPQRQTAIHAALWLLAAIFFTLYTAPVSGELARYTGVTVVMGGITVCALTYLLAERVLRPVTAVALASRAPDKPVGPGVKGRMLLAWVTASGVPLLGLALVGIDVATRDDLSRSRIAASILVLSGLAIVTGLFAMIVAAKSVAEPVSSVRDALARVQGGDFDVDVPVNDASEIGLLQTGFNEMAAGLRERERLRDAFGRQVGEDVARAALEGDLALGGQEREVAVLFVDLVGSTAMAGERAPEEVVALLNRFFGIVVDVVGAHGGWVNKFEGDGALCIFGAPVARDDAAACALRAARTLRVRLVRELPEADAGIGVSAGPAVAG